MGNQEGTPGAVAYEAQTWGERVAEGKLPVIGAGAGGGASSGFQLTPRGGGGGGVGVGPGSFATGPGPGPGLPAAPGGALGAFDMGPGGALGSYPGAATSAFAPAPQVFLPPSIDGYVASSDLFQPSFLSGLADPLPAPTAATSQQHPLLSAVHAPAPPPPTTALSALPPRSEDQLARVLEKNTQLTLQNSDLQKQVQHLQHVSATDGGGGMGVGGVGVLGGDLLGMGGGGVGVTGVGVTGRSPLSTSSLSAMGVSNITSAVVGGVGVTSSLGTGSGVAAAIANSAAAAAADARHQDSLDNILKQMREATELRKELEREHAEALSQLREKQADLARSSGSAAGTGAGGGGGGGPLACSAPTTSTPATPASAAAAAAAVAADKAKSYETIEALQSKIRELEKKTELQNVRHEELLLEMAAIKRTAQAAKGASAAAGVAAAAAGGCSSAGTTAGVAGAGGVTWKGSRGQEVQTSPESGTSTPDSSGRIGGTSTSLVDSLLDPASRLGRSHVAGHLHHSHHHHHHHGAGVGPPAAAAAAAAAAGCMGSAAAGVASSAASAARVGSPGASAPAASAEIDRIMAKIEQDNRILAELDKTRSTIAGGASAATPSATLPTSATSHHATGLLGGSDHLMASGYMMMPSGVAGLPGVLTPAHGTAAAGSTATPFGVMGYGVSSATPGVAGTASGRLMPQIPSAATAAAHAPGVNALMAAQYADLDARNSFLNGNLVFSAMQQDPSSQAAAHLLAAADTKQLDMLEIPGKGRCFVFIAKFSYDPLTQSPNENPEAELPLSAGDYVLVWGHMDEDGFCDGELLDGRRGLVPSNYIQKLVGDDLLDFHQSAVQGLRAAALDCDPSAMDMAAAAGQHVDDIASAAHDVVMMDEALAKRGLGDLTLQELEDILEEEDENLNQTGEGPVPPPKQLSLERQLHKSVLISWAHPDGCPPAAVDSYHVYVDGVLKTTVKATERPRALVEGVDSMRPHRISVRSITPNRRTSRDAACTMVVGKDIPQAPSNVKAGNVTSTSAVISWLPANSNHQHVVCVNNVEVRTVKPGVYRHTITGLAPNTVYRVTVRAKNIRQQTQTFDEKTSSLQMERCSAHIDFRTLPKGLPDPPVDIQVEAGPQDGTLLVTWLPVAGHGGAHANGAPVTGYAVYADGKKVTDVDSPTGDHALIDINKLLGLNPKQVTVRTKSRDSQSSDSLPTAIPGSILRKGARDDRRGRFGMSMGPLRHHPGGRARLDAHGQLIIEPDENLSDKEVYPNHMNIPAIEITKDSASEANFSEDDYLERRGRYGHHMGGTGPTGYTPRSHAERGRPPPLPHERAGRMGDYGPRDPRRDERDRLYSSYPDDPRGRHGAAGERGYRGSGPRGPGGSAGPAGVHHSGLDKRARWFMALFDYDPAKDSPNPDACEEELTFNQGDTMKVYGEKDADGFYWGEFRGRRGYVPHNMVMEVQDGAPGVAGGRDRRGAHGSGGRADRWGDIYERMPVKRMIALYDYDPQELSPNVDSEVELSFNTGNIIYVYGDMDDDGFYMGELDGTRGLVPSNFLTEAPADYEFDGGGRGPRGGRGGPMGPGARGPPPPPRDGRMDPRAMDRRKDACQAPNQLDYRGDSMVQGPGGMRTRGGQRGDRRSGSGRQPTDQAPHMDQQAQGGGAGHGGGPGKQTSPQQQQQQSKPMKGIPSVVPDFVIPNNKESPTAPGPTQSTSKFPDAPNLMQKFSEITGGADTSVDNIISKGKELIFMKFGLGK